jgi:hypothetical protein
VWVWSDILGIINFLIGKSMKINIEMGQISYGRVCKGKFHRGQDHVICGLWVFKELLLEVVW